jgi:hypothetical protein
MQQRMIDDAVVGLPVVCVCGATWRIWTFPKFVMAPLCGYWMSLLLAKGSRFSYVGPTYVGL